MKKFFRIGRKKSLTPEASPQPKRASFSGAGGSNGIYDIRDKDLTTKLHKAAWNNEIGKVRQLAKKDANPLDKENRTPLHLACARGNALVVQELLEWKAKVHLGDNDACTPLVKAVQCHHEDCVRLLLESRADPDVPDHTGDACLHYAVRDEKPILVELLLQCGKINIDIQNKKRQTPLHLAVSKKSAQIASLLLEQGGADPDVPDADGRTPLMHAAGDGSQELVQLLLRCKADASIKDREGWTAYDIAQKAGQDACVEALAGSLPKGAKGKTPAGQSRAPPQKQDLFGAPAADDLDDLSEAEGTLSKSEAPGGPDSWNDTDEESELEFNKKASEKKKVPGLNLAKMLRTSDEDLTKPKEDASKIPRLEDANKASPPTSARTGGTKIPLSARSSTSIKSVGSNWSDDSECFPSAREPKNQKPNLVALQQQRAQDPGGANQGGQKPDEVLWSDEESLPIDSSRDEKPKQTAADAGSAAGDKKEEAPPLPSSPPPPPPPVKADNLSDFDSDDEVEDQVGSPMASSTKKALEIAGISEKRQEEIMAELGMSDVSSVSDLSDDDIPNLAQKYSLNTSRVLSPVAEDSERSMSHRTKRTTGGKTAGTPRSTKKGKEEDNDSDWDDTTAASDFNTPRGPLKPQLSARSVQSNMSNWDSDEDEPVKEAPVKAQAAIQNNSQPGPQSSQPDIKDQDGENKAKLTETKEEIKENVTEPKEENIANVEEPKENKANVEECKEAEVVEATEHATAAMNTVTPVPEAVVATSAVTTSAKAPPSGGATKPTVKGGMDFQESEEEEEEESEWEKERREKQQKWEAEYQQKQEQMRLDAQKELQLQREAEEREKKEKEHQAQLEEIKCQQAEAQKKRDQLNRTAEDEEKSRQIELRRDKAEKQLAEARARQAAGFNHTLDLEDDEDDTYNGVDIPYSPRDMEKTGETAGLNTTQDDDGLSYSSTEAEDPPNVAVLLATSPPNFSMTNDSSSLIRLQEQLRETKRILERERSSRVTLENKRKNLETEKAELLQRLEDMSRLKSQLEQNKIDIEAKIRSCEYQLNEETEKRKNMEILYNKTKEQLNRKEEQYTEEIESKQRIELQMRNVQMELKSALSAVKQLEEEKEDLQRQMQHEKNQRQLQEQINEETLRLQQALADDSSKTAASQDEPNALAEAMSRLEEVDETRKQAIDSVDKLKTELYAAKMELERQRARYKEDHTLLASENEDLQSKIEELKSDIKLNEEALAHATVQYNIQLSTMKTENAVLASTLEKERQGYEKIQTEIDSLKNRLESANAEMEKAHNARSEMERNSYKEREEWTKVLERRDQELNTLKESNQNMSHKLGAAEGKVAAIENELHIANATLMERSNQLSTIQRELDQRKTAHDLAEEALRKIKEENVRFEARQEAMTDRVSSLQNETTELRRQLEDERRRAQSPTKSSSQDKLSQMLNTMQHENNKTRTSLEEKNSLLNESLTRMREELRVVDARKSSLEQELRHLGLELSDTHRKLTVAEASLELANKTKEQLEGERLGMKGELERVQAKLDLAQEKQLESQQHIAELTDRLEKAEQGVVATSQQLATQSATTEAVSRSKTEAEGAMHKLEVENAKLSASLAHENDKVSMLQRDLNESNKIRGTMEALLANLKTANAHLESKLYEATAAKTAASHDAEESQNLWDLEVKARSKLGLKISQLEKAKQEAQALYDEEKKKLRKALELKKAAELKLEAEIEKNQELQKEIANLKAYLKAAKRRLKELDTSEHRVNVLQADFDRERSNLEATLSTVRKQLDDVQGQLETEIQDKDRLQSQTAQLKQQINTHKQADRTMSKLQRTNQKLEQELKHYRSNYLDQSEIGRIRAELEARSRMELNQKLEEVNAYLEEQAQAREKLDSLRSENENELRKEFERTKRELLDELSKIKSSYKDSMSSSTSRDAELQRYKDMYENEVRLRGKLAEKLQQATEKALTAKLTQSFQHSLPMSNGFPSQNGWVGSSTPLGRSNHGHGESLGNKLKAELDRSIAKHLEKAPQLEISSPPRASEDPYGSSAFNKSSSEYLNVLKRNYLL